MNIECFQMTGGDISAVNILTTWFLVAIWGEGVDFFLVFINVPKIRYLTENHDLRSS